MAVVGTARCAVIARGTTTNRIGCAAGRGADSAVRCPYQCSACIRILELYDRQVRAAELSLTPVSSAAAACEWVRQYYAYEALPFNATVEGGVSRLLESSRFGWFFELSCKKEAIGYAVLTRAFDHEFGGEFAILTDFFILEPHRRQGLGSRALELLEKFARSQGFCSLDLYVLNRNAGVRDFYLRHGFRELQDRRPMTKSLSTPGPVTPKL